MSNKRQKTKNKNKIPDPEQNPGKLLKKYALQRASAVMATVGATQVLALIGVLMFGDSNNPSTESLIPWLVCVAVAGVFYLLWALPVRRQREWARYAAIVTAIAQALVFGTLALLSIIAAAEVNVPVSMTTGVLLFGTIASVHLFILRWLTPYGWIATDDPRSTASKNTSEKQNKTNGAA